MTKTKNYQLPQWEAKDRIRREDFNATMATIDTGIAGALSAGKTGQSMASAAQTAAGAAQTTANTARTEAAAAQSTANTAAAAFIFGSYTGNGADKTTGGQTINLGFRPRFLFISRGWAGTTGAPNCFLAIGEEVAANVDSVFSWADTGFKVVFYQSNVLQLNTSGVTYSYLAFR